MLATGALALLGSLATTAHAASTSYTPPGLSSSQGKPLVIVLAPSNETASNFSKRSAWVAIADKLGAKLVIMDSSNGVWDTTNDVSALSTLYSNSESGIEGASRYMVAYGNAGTTLSVYAVKNTNKIAGAAFISASAADVTAISGASDKALAVQIINSSGPNIDKLIEHFKTRNAATSTDNADPNDIRYYRTGASAWNADYSKSHFVRHMSNQSEATIPTLVYDGLLNAVSRWKTVEGDFTLRAKVRAGFIPGFDKITETVGSSSRNAYVYVPSAVRNGTVTGKVPVVMLFHGITANGDYFSDQTEWHRVAERNNFIVYAPTGSSFQWGGSTDLNRYRDVIDRFGTYGLAVNGNTYAIDTARIYMYGFSNGSSFVSKFALTYPDRIAAAAPWSIAASPSSSCTGRNKYAALPVWYGIGNADEYYPDDGSSSFLQHFRCLAGTTGSTTKKYSAFGVTDRINTTVYTGSVDNIEVRYSLAKDIVHGNINEHMENIWTDFFARYRKNSGGYSELIPTGGGNQPPTANFSFVTNGLTANFIDGSSDSDGRIVSRSWNFGDGSATSTATNPSKTYASARTYTVTLTVTDDGGATHSVPKAVTLTSGGGGAAQLLVNPGFESGKLPWTSSSGVITNESGSMPRSGSWVAWLNGYGITRTDTLSQTVSIPSGKTSATLSFYLHIKSSETTTTTRFDKLTIDIVNASGSVLTTCATYSNLDKGTSYVRRTCNLNAFIGQTVTIRFTGTEVNEAGTSFRIDDAALDVL